MLPEKMIYVLHRAGPDQGKILPGACKCWGKFILKVMNYNIALLPKNKLIAFVTFYANTLLLRYFLNLSRA